MLRIENIKRTLDEQESVLQEKAARILRLNPVQIQQLTILKRAIDARDGLHFVYTVAVAVAEEDKVLRRCHDKHVTVYAPNAYTLPAVTTAVTPRPVVVGAGPAGLFAALVLAHAGQKPILLERGQMVEQRQKDVEQFWTTGLLNLESNVQFGEGGAGAFSDGKLNTGTKDLRHRWILEKLVENGAPDSILYDAKPHIGTDMLHITLKNLRRELLSLGADLRYGHRLDDLCIENGQLTGLIIHESTGTYTLPCTQMVLALGHSSRDTAEMLYRHGITMEPKAFAVGVRIEHLQKDIDLQQYKSCAGHPSLPPSTYKLSCHLENGRSAFSFCVCPGGQVVAAASEAQQVVTNGMSRYARDLENINGALLVNVTPEDFPSAHPLAGFEFQRSLEKAAFSLGGNNYYAPCQRVEDFLAKRPSTSNGKVKPSYRPGVTYTDLHLCLPSFVSETIALALPVLDRKIHGYASADALLTAVEARSSCPVKLPRDTYCESNIRGIFPCGEGAGQAGGILSAAADGMRCAEGMLSKEK